MQMNRKTIAAKGPLIIYIHALCCLSFASCQEKQPYVASGFVIDKFFFRDPKTKVYALSETDMPSTKTWYKDSLVVQELLGIRGLSSEDGSYRRWLELIGYTFIDLRKGWFYHYKTFTDMAALVAKWEQNDSASFLKHGGGWRFYREKNLTLAAPPRPLSDTVRNGITYKRQTFPIVTRNGGRSWMIGYFRCDKKGTLFQYDRALSRQMGCPMTRIESVYQKDEPFGAASDIEFVRESLTPEEMKVFAAWEENAMKNPVK